MPFTEMQTAYDHFNEHRNTLRMTTGSANLDSLILTSYAEQQSFAIEMKIFINYMSGLGLTDGTAGFPVGTTSP
jgi:hypothetical protein